MIDREGNSDNNVFEADGDKSSLRDDPVGGSGSVIYKVADKVDDESCSGKINLEVGYCSKS